MLRLFLVVPLTLATLTACGLSPEQEACVAFLEAAEACWERAREDYEGDPPEVCATYNAPLLRTIEEYACMTEAYERGDCKNVITRDRILNEIASCRTDG